MNSTGYFQLQTLIFLINWAIFLIKTLLQKGFAMNQIEDDPKVYHVYPEFRLNLTKSSEIRNDF